MLIYVMGRGHSGSTILGVLLGNSPFIANVGELAAGLLMEHRGHLCSCGKAMIDCEFWKNVEAHFIRHSSLDWVNAANILVAHAHIRALPRTLLARSNSPAMGAIANLTKTLVDAVVAASGKPNVLDASKEPTRALFLLRFMPDVRVIHLVRDPRHVVASHYWRFKKNDGYFHFLRRKYHAPVLLVPFMLLAALSWTAGNLICEIARCFRPNATVRVRYEDLCDDAVTELRRIGTAIDISLEDVVSRIERDDSFAVGHNVGGNAMRHHRHVKFQPTQTNKDKIPKWLSLITLGFCWALMLLYGYRLKSPIGNTTSPQPSG